jgi:hypothetical protein
VGAVAARCPVNREELGWQGHRGASNTSIRQGHEMRPQRNRQRTATIVPATIGSRLNPSLMLAVAEGLAHAAGMGFRSGDRQSHWSERAHQQQHQQHSGGQTMHR